MDASSAPLSAPAVHREVHDGLAPLGDHGFDLGDFNELSLARAISLAQGHEGGKGCCTPGYGIAVEGGS